jgi:hypothetical protein
MRAARHYSIDSASERTELSEAALKDDIGIQWFKDKTAVSIAVESRDTRLSRGAPASMSTNPRLGVAQQGALAHVDDPIADLELCGDAFPLIADSLNETVQQV